MTQYTNTVQPCSAQCQKQTTETAKQQPCCHLLLHTTLHPLLKAASEQQDHRTCLQGKKTTSPMLVPQLRALPNLKKITQRKHILESITIKKQWYKFSLENFIFPLKNILKSQY